MRPPRLLKEAAEPKHPFSRFRRQPDRHMSTRRQSYQSGHKPRCLVIIDETPECDIAIYYATRWAARVGGAVVMLHVIDVEDRSQQWLGVADIMKAEAIDQAHAAFDSAANRVSTLAPVETDRVVREGNPIEQIMDVIENDLDISIFVLAAGTGPEGPGPIISGLAKNVGHFPVPVTIVPGNLADADLDALT